MKDDLDRFNDCRTCRPPRVLLTDSTPFASEMGECEATKDELFRWRINQHEGYDRNQHDIHDEYASGDDEHKQNVDDTKPEQSTQDIFTNSSGRIPSASRSEIPSRK